MNYKIPIYFVFLAAVWGASFMFMRVGAPELGAYAFSGLRVGIAGLILSPILLKPSCFKEYKEHWLKLSLIGILNTGIPFMLFTLATYHLTAGVTSVINASVPVMTGVISHFFFKYYLSKQQFLGLIIGILGVALLMLDGLQGGGSIWAFISALGACLCYAMSSNLAKRYLFAISPMTIAASGLLASGIVMLPIVILFFPQTTISWTAWSSVFAIAVLSTAIAMIVFYQLIQLLDPTKTAMVTLFIPIFGIFWGVLLLDEKVSLQMLLGTVIILLGTALTIFRRKSINLKS
ncbi:DMT family transporter [Pasteurella skyensis]|uniref:DMT family transporter n=1 Tax=Phocoenobacter skyensis TaxID=97481 RepID=A0AAJ6P0D8_9PAST|nr:DMT family transporter [Pasteurella skyensis]MDP8162508.1 DMT family transporter [Pasteurella skyensis]MDP8172473.1 DMT family transporter [Pasteurella skyensis]MDP8177498.1 DMT family transporter [Pasteurella skyensis]MDP8178728.1 DMT family transporter [Pasteurella skyensis]MDP8182982.1 DMT family transporter [Pasteurella skyensis]